MRELHETQGIEYIVGDVTKKEDVERIVKNTLQSYARLRQIDVLVNNAGTFTPNLRLAETAEMQWDYVINTNLKSVYLMSKAVLPHMIRQRSGVIINVGSVIASIGAPSAAAYIASKGGVIALTKSMAKDYAKYNIRVNCISPSIIDTDMTKSLPESVKKELIEQHLIKRLGKPSDIAEAIIFLIQSDWITGMDLKVDGGVGLR